MKRRISPSQLVVFVILLAGLLFVTGYAVRLILRNMASAEPPPPTVADPTAEPITEPITEPTAAPSPVPGNGGIEAEVPLPVIPILAPPSYDMTLYDTVILNARLINPETRNDMEGFNIGIRDGRIAAITRRPLQGSRVIDATGLIAAPGFIDILSFRITEVGARFKITDGVTTNMQMHGGAFNARNEFAHLINNPPIINFGKSNFISGIRSDMGYYPQRIMTSPTSIDTVVARARQNILDGSVGVSMIPEYTPGVQGAEMLALSHLAAEMGVPLHFHVRYATPHGERNSLVAIQEVLDLARETGAAVHINHINSTGATHVAEEAFAMLHAAIAEGLLVTACIYPYDYWGTNTNSARFAPNWQTRFGITYSDLQIPNTTTRLTAETFAYFRPRPQLVFARGTMPEHEIRLAMQQPFMMIGSDTMIGAAMQSHPRGAGTFSRTIGKYARDEGVITLMEALSMMTIRPARHLHYASYDMRRKGRLEIGADADIVLFCFDTIIDTATPENVASYSRGIYYVFVNGQLGLDRTGVLNARAGRPVRSRFASPAEPEEACSIQIFYNFGPGWWGFQDVAISSSSVQMPVFPLFGHRFVDLREVATATRLDFYLYENGEITFGQARLQLGETAFTSYGQHSNLHHEPVIFRGSVFVPVQDLRSLSSDLSPDLEDANP
ncbi:MAG: amidohydrolase family protein [Defluviitaleaceae bacterium]|nr:amidohydrolase family protein [Defluviitaleaceae bacterium]MCL2239404.1 amidohydrolase family protein [Defluviitaleaceae bacterium]